MSTKSNHPADLQKTCRGTASASHGPCVSQKRRREVETAFKSVLSLSKVNRNRTLKAQEQKQTTKKMKSKEAKRKVLRRTSSENSTQGFKQHLKGFTILLSMVNTSSILWCLGHPAFCGVLNHDEFCTSIEFISAVLGPVLGGSVAAKGGNNGSVVSGRNNHFEPGAAKPPATFLDSVNFMSLHRLRLFFCKPDVSLKSCSGQILLDLPPPSFSITMSCT